MNSLKCSYDEKERVWSGANQPLVHDFNCSLGEIIYNNLRNFPKKVCQVSDIDGREVTNEELLSWSIRLAQCFKKFVFRHQDVIGIVAKNSTYLNAVAVGCFMNCTPFHAVNGALDQNTIQKLFGITAPKVIFCDGEVYEKIYAATKSLKPLLYTLTNHIEGVPRVEDLLNPTIDEHLYKPEPLMLGGEQTVAILCSSGTTGMPKCVCLSNCTWQLANIFGSKLVTSEDVIFTNGSFDWVSGLCFALFSNTTSCKRVITNHPYTPDYFIELVKKYKITCVSFPPRYVALLTSCPTATADNLSSIRFCLIGGDTISLSPIKRLQSILKKGVIHLMYGLTETGFISINPGNQRFGSVGNLFSGKKVRIVDELGKNLPPNEIGEVCVNTGFTWNGYFGNPIETQSMQDSLGWFHTGDLGYIDDEKALYIVDRKKNIMKYHEMLYWPAEIEEVIRELEEVEDVCVVGIYDERNGDEAGALVVLRKGAELTEQLVREHVGRRLPVYYKQLHAGVIFVHRLPQNSNGKVLRKEAKMLFECQVKADAMM